MLQKKTLFLKGRTVPVFVFMVSILLSCVAHIAAYAMDCQAAPISKQQAFEHVFGDAVRLNPDMVQKVKADTAGKRHYVDKNGDGKPEEVWFIDIDPRHNEKNRPMLVRVIDKDGDLKMGKEPDRDNDLYIADWNADGTVDAVIDYEDVDGDQDVKQTGIYFHDERRGLRVWLGMDYGNDNLIFYDVDYTYYQHPCQLYSHFGGNKSIVSMYMKPETGRSGAGRWVPFWENPFLFFDSDKDGITEEVIRVEGEDDIVHYLRWSFNVNPKVGHPRNFDVSITACAPGWMEQKDRKSDFNLRLGKGQTEYFTVRGIPAGPVLKRSLAREFLRSVTWARVLMTWNENDLNIAWNYPEETFERWEGIIAAPSTDPEFYMPQIGGPNCGPYNKRYELMLHPAGPNEFYFNPADHRVHIKHSDRTWLKVDYDGDRKVDMDYRWTDCNGDGIMDRIEVDVDGDGKIDDSRDIDVSRVKSVKWSFAELNETFAPFIKAESSRKYLLVEALTAALESVKKGAGQEPIRDLIEKSMRGGNFSDDIARRLMDSDETMMYYLTLVADRQIVKLKKQDCGSKPFWEAFNAARHEGNTKAMMQAVTKEFKLKAPVADYAAWVARLRKNAD